MDEHEFDFDVAISFVNVDLGVAAAIRDGLGDTLNVFIYTRKQEEVAGTDGLESFRAVFRHRARLVVILYRAEWGQTKWTRVESEAITDRFLDQGPDFLFVVTMDEAPPPKWLPEKLIRLRFADFGVQEAVGAIKARALSQGSVVSRPSTAFLALRAQEAADFERQRNTLMKNEHGVQQAQKEAERLVQLIRERAEEAIAAAPGLELHFGSEVDWCVIRAPGVAVRVSYRNNIINVLDEARLEVVDLRGAVLLPGESGFPFRKPKRIHEIEYRPELTRASGWCWRRPDGSCATSEEIADQCLPSMFSLIHRLNAGQLPSPGDWD
ncbi:MAG TPA: hypothetical protein VFK13_05700 [Gemmatimonadaceae bacterium]|nr:hypothetical protein [Gemmatimonadaceae bacterium]